MPLIVFLFSLEGLVPTKVADRKIRDSLSYIACLVYTDPACLVLSILYDG